MAMLDKFFKRFRKDNGVTPDVETSAYINAEGLEDKIHVPSPTKDDKRWAKKLKDATADAVTGALKGAIEEGRNWRVWYLLNRPYKTAKEYFVGATKKMGFDGESALPAGIEHAAKHNNVTAAYLLLKYAEKNSDILMGREDDEDKPVDPVREQLNRFAMAGLQNAADKPGGDVFALLAQTFSTLHDKDMHPAAPLTIVDYKETMKQAAIKAGAQGNEAHLDAMLQNRLLTPEQFVEAFMGSFYYEKLYDGAKPVTATERHGFLDWLTSRGIVDQTFADEALMVETRIVDAKRSFEEAVNKGWKISDRNLPLPDGSIALAGAEQAEITLGLEREAQVTYVFNYSTNRAHRIQGSVAQEIPRQHVDKELAAEGREFLDSIHVEAPALEWKKGEPFRLRFKATP